jgi:hypothetical protein
VRIIVEIRQDLPSPRLIWLIQRIILALGEVAEHSTVRFEATDD